MSNSELLQPQKPGIQYTEDGLSIGKEIFQTVQKAIWHKGTLNITGRDQQDNTKTITGLDIDQSMGDLEAQRRRFPNAAILSKCLGLAQLSIGEAALAENKPSITSYFQEAISSLERALEQEAGDPETTLNLTLAYCYAEDLEVDSSEDYTEFISDLLAEVPMTVLPEIAAACSIRGSIYFDEEKTTLGFNFLKQELFLWRYQQLLDPKNSALQERLKTSAEDLIKRCHTLGWQNLAEQLASQLTAWVAELPDPVDSELDSRLVEAAEFERAAKAYLSHDDKASAIACFEDHTQLMKVIYQDHAPMDCYAEMLIESYVNVIDLHTELAQTEKADKHQRELVELLKSLLIAYPGTDFYLNSLSVCCEAMADRRLAQGKPADALPLYLESLAYNEKLATTEPAPEEYRNHQLGILKKLTALYTNLGDDQSSLHYQDKLARLEEGH